MSDLLNGLNEQEAALFGSFADMSIDDLEDLPGFDPYPNGAHLVTIKFETKVINDKPAVILGTTYVEVGELEDPEAKPPKAGDTYDFMFGLASEYGQGSLKAVLKPLAEATGKTSPLEIMEAVNGAAALIVTKQRHDKSADVMRCNLKSLVLA